MGRDEDLMGLALAQARTVGERGHPIAALLYIDGTLMGSSTNTQKEDNSWSSHAEASLVKTFGPQIRTARKAGLDAEIFTTLEPCLMCMGTMVHNRINRIVYSCPDPAAGAASIQPPTEWYKGKWPEIVHGIRKEEGYKLFVDYMKEQEGTWSNVLWRYEKMKKEW